MAMKREEFCVENWPKINKGVVIASIDHLVGSMLSDCEDRPFDSNDREVTIRIKVKPVPNATRTGCDGFKVKFELGSKSPKWATREYEMAAETMRNLRGEPVTRAKFYPDDLMDEPELPFGDPHDLEPRGKRETNED